MSHIPQTERNTPMRNQHRLKSLTQDVLGQRTRHISDQEVTRRYGQELLKLKTLNRYGRQELERRGLPVPPVNPREETEGGHQDA